MDNYANRLVWMSTKPSKFSTSIGSNWKTDFIDISNNDIIANYQHFQIVFEIVKGQNQVEEIAIDEIEIEKSMCISKKYLE